MKDIVCKGAKRAALFQGLPEMQLSDIRLEKAVLVADSGITCSDSRNIILKDVTVYVKDGQPIRFDKEVDITKSETASGVVSTNP